ncbi:MAG: prolyl oligopeptidase family serine peptidase [Candidatus Omnitrophica bacterium]|nr:prolyl oligopeptidase family serine peptidase [Candidatus Omnitrophota bacterium]
MKFGIALGLVLALTAVECSSGAERPTDLIHPQGEAVVLETPEGVRFGIWGKDPTYPAPVLFVFSSTIQESLEDPYFRQCGNALSDQGYLCVSLDLPGQGREKRKTEPGGLAAWRHRSDQGEDFVTPFVEKAKSALDHLIESGYADPDRIAVCGTSRGGFMALQFAAAEPRIRATATFAPVTALEKLREFEGASNPVLVTDLSLAAKAEALAGRSLWIIIGDRDDRVGTDHAIAFARHVTQASLAQEKPADVTLIVQPEPKGHTTPQGAPELAAKWIAERLK